MGTADAIARLQQEIRDEADKLGLSIRKIAEHCFYEEEENGLAEEFEKFHEKFKKHLSRQTSTASMQATLERYLELILRHEKYAAMGLIIRQNVHFPELGPDFDKQMAQTSRKIARRLETDHDCDE